MAPLGCGSFSDFPYFSRIWQFWRVLLRYFEDASLWELLLCFSHDWTDAVFFWEEYRTIFITSLSRVHTINLTCILLMLILVTWLRQCLSGFSTVKLNFFPISHTVLFWKEVTMSRPHLRSKDLCSLLRTEYLHKLFEILLCRSFVSSLPFVYYLSIYLYHYGLMGIYFIF